MKPFRILPIAALMATSMSAMADSTIDIVNTLVTKGVLTEEEGRLLTKGREGEKASQDQALEKATKSGGKITISDVIDNATFYGDIRARYEFRNGEDSANNSEDRERGRYKLVLGLKTTAGDFYSDIALSMGANGRSDNATFGNGTNGANSKENVYVKRAMLGWKVTDWLKVEAGRVANPLYTTSMVWDGDLTFEGLVEKIEYKWGNVNLFGNFAQSQYLGDRQDFNISTNDRDSNGILAFQGGAKFDITDTVSAKAAVTFTKFTNDHAAGASVFIPGLGTNVGKGASLGTTLTATNDIRTIEIPAEIVFKLADGMKLTAFGDYVYNLDGDDRFKAAVNAATATSAITGAAIRDAGNDDKAWLLGLGLAMKQDKQPKKGDWSAKLWYQDVGIYALDPNTVDSDFMDSRVNMKGIVFKGEYLLRDNVVLNFAAGHATRKNDKLAAAASASDIALNIDSYNLYQMDITYKF
ncbi:Putative porin [Methylobacillus rhizosphaerae]|uniref:Putative porin n=1 Tax=Methylobacillus rhizosphaerae TaxID=551994 RepID=A0A238Z6U8_9PROT|nr:putative porin [Methylobacillus rhizosphaerae]SNR78708.1 Putative porin [Methylobacillus rhizosphaerae]